MNVLVTGGAGYIGSHAAMRLLEDGHAVTIVDNLFRGNRGAIEALQAAGEVHFVEADLGDRATVLSLLGDRRIEVVMHFAALAYVGESVEVPLRYYRNNSANALSLLEAMDAVGVDRIVFSSSCATYGEPPPELIPIRESCPQQPINPYGRTKLAVEQMLFDQAHARAARGEAFAFATLRYFNVAGCDRAGRLGEDHDPETHLIPICLDAALGKHDQVTIFGTDYDTPDGTCIRDYVHVDDLIDAHVAVMNALRPGEGRAYNLGIGRGYSVGQVVEACRRVSGVEFQATEGRRRPGDPPDEIIATAWRWRRANPDGYAS
jgi:UDP-glucose 4-epimerase